MQELSLWTRGLTCENGLSCCCGSRCFGYHRITWSRCTFCTLIKTTHLPLHVSEFLHKPCLVHTNSQNLCVFLWWTGIWRSLPCPASWLTWHCWVCLKGGEHLDPGETPQPSWVLAVNHRMHTCLSPALYQFFHLYWLRDVWLHYMPTKLPSLKLPRWCKRSLVIVSDLWP